MRSQAESWGGSLSIQGYRIIRTFSKGSNDTSGVLAIVVLRVLCMYSARDLLDFAPV